MNDLRKALDEAGITMQIRRDQTYHDDGLWPDESTHWKCTFVKAPEYRTMTVRFHQGPLLTTDPERDDVMGCVLRDAFALSMCGIEFDKALADQSDDLVRQFAREFGEQDEKAARRSIQAMLTQTKKLARFLGGADQLDVWLKVPVP